MLRFLQYIIGILRFHLSLCTKLSYVLCILHLTLGRIYGLGCTATICDVVMCTTLPVLQWFVK